MVDLEISRTSQTGVDRLISVLALFCLHSCRRASRRDSSMESNSDFRA